MVGPLRWGFIFFMKHTIFIVEKSPPPILVFNHIPYYDGLGGGKFWFDIFLTPIFEAFFRPQNREKNQNYSWGHMHLCILWVIELLEGCGIPPPLPNTIRVKRHKSWRIYGHNCIFRLRSCNAKWLLTYLLTLFLTFLVVWQKILCSLGIVKNLQEVLGGEDKKTPLIKRGA